MRLRNIPGAREEIQASPYCIQDPASYKGRWPALFQNQNPIHIEIGMGKGQFLMNLAKLNPDINFIGIEKFSSVLLRALQKMGEDPLPNLFFIRMDAEEIAEIFAYQEVKRIYLNFSDPWPKDRHAKRRLTSRQFLERYRRFLSEDGTVEFKTDNDGLFEFSLLEIEAAGWKLNAVTFDLHNDTELNQKNVFLRRAIRFTN